MVKAETAIVCNSDEKDTSSIDIPVAATAETPATAGDASNSRRRQQQQRRQQKQ
jgi:hypothetical protein